MLLILFNQQELDNSDADLAKRLSAFNFCNPFDHIFPFANSVIDTDDRAHLWGVYSGTFGGRIIYPIWLRRRRGRR